MRYTSVSGPGYEGTKFVSFSKLRLKKKRKLETCPYWAQGLEVAFVNVAEAQGGGTGRRLFRFTFILYHLVILFVDKCLALRSLLLPLQNRPYHCRVLEKDSVTV